MFKFFLGFAAGVSLAPILPSNFWELAVIRFSDQIISVLEFIKSLV